MGVTIRKYTARTAALDDHLLHAKTNTLRDRAAFPLSHCADEGDKEPAHSRGCLKYLCGRLKLHSMQIKGLQQGVKIRNGASETVQFINKHYIKLMILHILHKALHIRPIEVFRRIPIIYIFIVHSPVLGVCKAS
ncbi:hypothetical protein D3C73_1013160 [compost metagenome]